MILDYLKQETSRIHKQVEGKNLATLILDHSISKDQFILLLQQNLYFYETIEKELRLYAKSSDINLTPFINHEKSDRLKKDLEINGFDLGSNHSQSFSHPLSSNEDLIGAVYVVEGSSLGVMLINKHLSKCPELKNINKHHFYGADTKDTLRNWTNFRDTVVTHQDMLNKQLILDSAIKTFKLFDQIMESTR